MLWVTTCSWCDRVNKLLTSVASMTGFMTY